MRKLNGVALAILCSFSLASALWAQSQATTGIIEGTVTDATGAALPGATVSLKNTATNFEQTVTTDREGKFRGVLLPLGPYRVTVTLQGFATLVREGLKLELGQTINVPMTMKLSAISEQV